MHIHHITPTHMTGGVANNHPSNLIELTVSDHAEAHRILFEQYGMWQDEYAWKGLAGLISKEEIARKAVVESNKLRVGKNSALFGKSRPDVSKRMKENNPMKLGMTNAGSFKKGCKRTEESKKKQSESIRSKKWVK